MRGRSVDTDGRALSRRVVAKGAGAGAVAAALGALGLRTSARPVAAQDEQADQEVLAAWSAAWSSGSAEGAAAVYTEDGVYEDIPFGETVQGRAAIAEYWQAYFEEAQEGALTIESAVAIPGGFVVQWRDEFTHAPTGAPVSYRGISILEVADGQVARETAYYDQATIYTQEGGTCEGPAAEPAATPATG
jgi:steroid delta-isomerase-like uncharacterized protein